MRLKNIFKCIIFVLMTALILVGTFKILWISDDVYSKQVFSEFYDLPRNSIDVVLIGSSSVREYYSSVEAYDDCGLASYPLATGNQPLSAAKYVIKEAEKTQNPKLYVIDIRQAYFDGVNDGAIRRTADAFKFSLNRINLVNALIDNMLAFYPEIEVNKFDYYFSYTTYHSRWNELNQNDFGNCESEWMGYNLYNDIEDFESYDKSVLEAAPQPISEYNEKVLNDLLDYCDTLDAEVLFVSMPACYDESVNAMLNYTKELIENRGYTIKDLNYDTSEIGLDYSTDFKNYYHVNMWGAIKVTDYLSEWIQKNYSLKDNRNNSKYRVYTEEFESYKKARLVETCVVEKYLELLEKYDDCTIILSVKGDASSNLTNKITQQLNTLGLDFDVSSGFKLGFVGIIENGEVIYQNQDSSVEYNQTIGANDVYVLSQGDNGGDNCSIMINGTEYAINSRGINIVVFDNSTGECLDSVAFDTCGDGTASR